MKPYKSTGKKCVNRFLFLPRMIKHIFYNIETKCNERFCMLYAWMRENASEEIERNRRRFNGEIFELNCVISDVPQDVL